jgi:branched-chain amino acid transport system ATP-binding protein
VEPQQRRPIETSAQLPDPTPAISLSKVSVAFGGILALDEVSLDLHPGETLGVIGPNGAGKTTLLNVVSGFVRPSTGTVSFYGKVRRRIAPTDLPRLGIARTLQGVGSWARMTVMESLMAGAHTRLAASIPNCILGMPLGAGREKRLRERGMEQLERFGLGRYASMRVGALPYGARKLVALARALMVSPSVLLLDEPASGLTEGETTEMAAALRALPASVALLIIEHRVDLVVGLASRIAVLNFGRLIKVGPPLEVVSDPSVKEAYLGPGA